MVYYERPPVMFIAPNKFKARQAHDNREAGDLTHGGGGCSERQSMNHVSLLSYYDIPIIKTISPTPLTK